MNLTLFSHPECSLHDVDAEHPECPARIGAIMDQLIASGLELFIQFREPSLVDIKLLKEVHEEEYIDDLIDKNRLLQQQENNQQAIMLDADTAMMSNSFQAARRAAGAAVDAVDEVMTGNNKRAFGAVRPPGHHAVYNGAMGFCLLSNVAIAAKYAVKKYGLSRIAIVDFDVHHGNGTEDIVQGDINISLFSSYQNNFYPFPDASKAKENVTHTPLPSGCDGQQFREAITPWFLALEKIQPQLIIISAGFDAHNEDPLAHLRLKEEDYAWVTQKLVAIANQYSEGRIVSMLEGGYDLSALSRSVVAHLRVLMEN